MKQRYPISLFLLGFIMNFFKNCLLNFVMIILLIAGIWYRPCLYLGLVILAIDIILAFILQLKIRRALVCGFAATEKDKGFKDIVLDPNWVENVKNYTEEKVREGDEVLPPSDKDENN